MFKFLLRRLLVALTTLILIFGAFIGKAQCPNSITATSLTVITLTYGTPFSGNVSSLNITTSNGSSSFSGSEIISSTSSTVTVDLAFPTTGVTNDSNDVATFIRASDGTTNQDCFVGTMLPLTLLDFSGKTTGNGSVLFNWQTAHEIGIDHFELQESEDGKNWKTVYSRKSVGKSLNVIKYSYDYKKSLTENTFFRLKIVDQDQISFYYSKILYVKRDDSNTIKFYPNPFNDVLNIEGDFSSLAIIDKLGNTVLTSTEKEININSLPSGLYSMQIFDELGKPRTYKISKN